MGIQQIKQQCAEDLNLLKSIYICKQKNCSNIYCGGRFPHNHNKYKCPWYGCKIKSCTKLTKFLDVLLAFVGKGKDNIKWGSYYLTVLKD